MHNWVLGRNKTNEILKLASVPDGFMDGYVIGMTAHSSPIEGQHLKQQNIVLLEWKARIHGEKNQTTVNRGKSRGRKLSCFWGGGGSDWAVAWQLKTDI